MSRDLIQTTVENRNLEVRSLYKSHTGSCVLEDISFSSKSGEIIAVIGSSGCGKSTLLRCLNFLDRPDSGEIIINGVCFSPAFSSEEEAKQQVRKLRDAVGIVFQYFNLFPHLTIEQNITLALQKVKQFSLEKSVKIALKILRELNMETFRYRRPDSLSGGQQQRVAIARMLAMDPEVVLYDEPFSALDPQGVKEIMGLMKDLKKSGKIQILVAHNMNIVKHFADRVILIESGRIIENLTTDEIFEENSNSKILQFISTLSDQ